MDLASLLSSMSLNDCSIKDFKASIGEHSTRFIIVNSSDDPHDFIIISQGPEMETYTLHKVFMNRLGNGSHTSKPVYGVKPLANSSVQMENMALYIAEQLEITKPVMIFTQLKEYCNNTVVKLVEAIKNYPG